MVFLGGQIGELACIAHFSGRSQLEVWDPKPLSAILRHQMELWALLGVKFVSIDPRPLALLYTLRPLQWCEKSPQLEFICESYASHKLTHLIDHHGTEWMPH